MTWDDFPVCARANPPTCPTTAEMWVLDKAAMIAGLKDKTGKSLEDWLVILRGSGLAKHKEFMTLLKGEHGLTHGFANMIADEAELPEGCASRKQLPCQQKIIT